LYRAGSILHHHAEIRGSLAESVVLPYFSFHISTTDFGYNGYTIASGFNDNSSGGNSIAGWQDEIYDI